MALQPLTCSTTICHRLSDVGSVVCTVCRSEAFQRSADFLTATMSCSRLQSLRPSGISKRQLLENSFGLCSSTITSGRVESHLKQGSRGRGKGTGLIGTYRHKGLYKKTCCAHNSPQVVHHGSPLSKHDRESAFKAHKGMYIVLGRDTRGRGGWLERGEKERDAEVEREGRLS
jgi:hypothetical protein